MKNLPSFHPPLPSLNDCKYSYDVNIREIGLTVLRSPIYAHHKPVIPAPEREYSFIDQGRQQFRYTLLPHLGSWETADADQRAAELNQPPIYVFETYHPDGKLPTSASFLSISQANVIATVLKQSEDNSDLILRCIETQRLLHQGIWDDVYLDITGPVRILDTFVRTQLSNDLRQADVKIEYGLSCRADLEIDAKVAIRKDEKVIVSNETPDETARPYTLEINGRRIYLNGWNWVPIDTLYGVRRPEKLTRLLGLAQRAQVNLLRVWGGGLIEREDFYILCDRLGILIWQEFIQCSSGIENYPPDNPDFIEWMVQEVAAIVHIGRTGPTKMSASWAGYG